MLHTLKIRFNILYLPDEGTRADSETRARDLFIGCLTALWVNLIILKKSAASVCQLLIDSFLGRFFPGGSLHLEESEFISCSFISGGKSFF